MTQRAMIYTRISRDTEGTALGVQRQEDDCRAYCKRLGWTVAEVLVDNDTSAYSGKKRPQYERLLNGIEAARCDAVVVWHPDRLHRSPRELEDFINLVERTGVAVASVSAGDYDLGSPEGRLTARIVGSVARKESEDKSRRLRRKHLELAEGGKVSGGGRRPFGYEKDRITLLPDEAALVTEMASRVLIGESVRSVVRDLEARGVRTVTGAQWSSTTLKRLLMSGRISGQREHHGRLVGAAEWPAIIEPDDTLRLRALLSDPARSKGRHSTARTYLLTGFVRCGNCGARMQARAVWRKGHRYRRYVCSVDRGGCNRVGIGAEPLEDLIVEAVMTRLDTPKLAKALTSAHKKLRKVSADSAGELAELERRFDELAEMYAAGEIEKSEWTTARAGLKERKERAEASIVAEVRQTVPERLLAGQLRAEWPTLTLDRRRAVLGAVIERVDIARTTRANNRFDPKRVGVAWKA